ncbi:unnamed protein product [Vicia faba]|uniref:Uncharacterized protein n=1 Tax=Vicia faba TaxID=3906 RepID=A0AAV1AG81_VICFA|nr:unnamed protein product [Vicia faba]
MKEGMQYWFQGLGCEDLFGAIEVPLSEVRKKHIDIHDILRAISLEEKRKTMVNIGTSSSTPTPALPSSPTPNYIRFNSYAQGGSSCRCYDYFDNEGTNFASDF